MVEISKKRTYRIIYYVIIISMTLAMCKFYLDGIAWEEPRLALSQLMDGSAYRPFVYRILIPFLVKGATHILPLSPTFYASLLICFSFFGFVFTLRSFAALYWESLTVVDAIGVLSLIMLFPFTLTNRHVYDISTLFLFTLGLKFMAQAKWKSFFLVFMVTCLNKETTILLTLAFFVCYWHRSRDKFFWELLILQTTIYVALRFATMWAFRNNPGGIVENRFAEHMIVFQTRPLLAWIFVGFGMITILLALWDWKKKPFFLRRAALGMAPIFLVLYFIWGGPLEIRVFYEIYPIILLLVLPSIGQLLGLPFWSTQYTHVEDSCSINLYTIN